MKRLKLQTWIIYVKDNNEKEKIYICINDEKNINYNEKGGDLI